MLLVGNGSALALLVFRLLGVSCSCHRFECFDSLVNRVDLIAVSVRIDGLQAFFVVDGQGEQRGNDLTNLAVSSVL